MLAVSHSRFGPGADVAELVEVAEPAAPQAGEALIGLQAAPINPGDLLRFEGRYGNTAASLPLFAGGEGIARILAVGPGVRRVKVGDLVLVHQYFFKVGAWRQRIVAPVDRLIPVPEADLLQLSMLTVNPATALLMLTEFVDIAEGDSVVQNAANSAVGHWLIKLAAIRNVKLINVVRREDAAAELRAAGAGIVMIDGPDLAERIADVTNGRLPRLAIDAIAGSATQRLGSSVAECGTVVNYGLLSGEPCQIAARDTVFRDVTLRGFWLQRWWMDSTPEQISEIYAYLGKLVASGELSVPIEATYPLAQIKAALAHSARPHRTGKIVLTMPAT